MKQVPNSINEPQGAGKDCDVIAPMQSHRGMKGCLRDGWRIFALQARKFSLQLLPVSLLVGIAALVFFASCYHAVLKCIVPVYTLSQGAENADMLENAFRLSSGMKMQIVVSGIVLLLAIMVGRGFVWHQIRHFYQHAALPSQRFLLPGKSVMRQIVRYLAYDVIRVIVLAALAAVAVLLWTKWTWASLTVLSLTIQPMTVLPFVVLFFLVLTAMAFVDVMLFPGCYKYLVEDASYKESLLFSLRHGTRRWGGYFVLALLTAHPVGFGRHPNGFSALCPWRRFQYARHAAWRSFRYARLRHLCHWCRCRYWSFPVVSADLPPYMDVGLQGCVQLR